MANIDASYASGILTLTLQNPPATGAPTALNVSLGNQTVTVNLDASTGQGTLPITVHPAVTETNYTVMVSAAGGPFNPPIPSKGVQLGSPNRATIQTQVLVPSTTGGAYTVVPVQKSDLRAYYLGVLNPVTARAAETGSIQDLYVIVSTILHTLVKHVMPAITAATYTPASLDANETSGLTDLGTNVLPSLEFALETLLPSGGLPAAAYAELKGRIALYQSAAQAYENDLATLPNLV